MAFHRGGQRRLYLAPEPVRVRILRDGVAVPGYQVAEGANVAYEASFPLQAGDVVEQRAVPPPSRPGALRGRRSDHGVSPSTSYLDVPPACRPALERLAREVVGGETDPWARARLLEAWLQSEDFIYTLRLPRRYDPRNPILDFLLNHRQGNCEWFATSLTLMLRALGHPARHAVGFWGGDPQEERPSVVMRGSHSHAWSEIYLHGAGWVALNPTPPDRTAADAGSVTVETGAQAQATQEEAFSFLGYDHAAWRAFWGRVGRGLDRHLVAPVAFFFSRRAGYAGWVLLVLGLWALARQREHARLRGRVVAPGTRLPPGPYGRALMLLARKGMRRRGHQTARAFARSATARFPRAGPALWTLTVMYERLRFGGGAADRDRRAAQDALDDLRKALRKPSGEGPPA
jgi:transglutaminase-like putative cysteine protease